MNRDWTASSSRKGYRETAARPLDDEVVKYAEQRNLGDARGDLEWMQKAGAEITSEDVDHFLQEKKKGEFQ